MYTILCTKNSNAHMNIHFDKQIPPNWGHLFVGLLFSAYSTSS